MVGVGIINWISGDILTKIPYLYNYMYYTDTSFSYWPITFPLCYPPWLCLYYLPMITVSKSPVILMDIPTTGIYLVLEKFKMIPPTSYDAYWGNILLGSFLPPPVSYLSVHGTMPTFTCNFLIYYLWYSVSSLDVSTAIIPVLSLSKPVSPTNKVTMNVIHIFRSCLKLPVSISPMEAGVNEDKW